VCAVRRAESAEDPEMDLEDRKRVRCKACRLVQFVNKAKQCVRCHASYAQVVTPAPVVEAPPPPAEVNQDAFHFGPGTPQRTLFWLPALLRLQRSYIGLTQKELAARNGWPRTYISKIEGGKSMISIPQLPLYCEALETSPAHIFRMAEFLVDGK
jgi:DNA-binding XRE family transcriptional regulator